MNLRTGPKPISIKRLYWLCGAVVVAIMLFAAFAVANQRAKVFESRLESLHQLQTDKLLQLRQELSFQSEIMLKTIIADEQLLNVLNDIGRDGTNNPTQGQIESYRQLKLVLASYLKKFESNAVTQLGLYLSVDQNVLINTTQPQVTLGELLTFPDMVTRAQSQKQLVSGLSLEADGLGFKSVLPLQYNDKTVASLALVLDIKKVAGIRQAWANLGHTTNLFMQTAILHDTRVFDAFYNQRPQGWFRANDWSTQHPSQMLHSWIEQGIVDTNVEEYRKLVPHADKQYLMSVMPWQLWGQQTNDTQSTISVQWQDVTDVYNAYLFEQKIGAMILLLSTFGVVLLALLIIRFLLGIAKREMALQQSLLQQSERKFAALFRLSPLPILLNRFDDGAYVDANPAMELLVGYNPQELKQLSYWDLTPARYAEAEQQQLQSLSQTGSYGPYIKQYCHKNGELIDIELNGVLFVDTAGDKYIWTIIKDIREIKRVEKLKDDFVSTVSHELRTPLTSIAGSLGLVLGGAVGELNANAERLLSIAHKNSQRLNLLINDLLDIEKLMAGKMRFEPAALSLPELLNEALEQNQPFAKQHDIKLTLIQPQPLSVWVDNARIQQVLANYISNAVKFSPAHTEVTISAEQHGQTIKILVQDQGPGISDSDQKQLFKRFSQLANAEHHSKGGTGLGLAISHEILLQSGGDVGVTSSPGQGATFWLTLPIYHFDKPLASQEVSDNTENVSVLVDDADIPHVQDWLEKPVNPELLSAKLGQFLSNLPSNTGTKRVLHIDDDTDLVTIMRLQLEKHFEYHAVTTIEAAKAELSANTFDLVLLDLELSDGNSINLLPNIVQHQGDIPLIIFTAQDTSTVNKALVKAAFSKSRFSTNMLATYLTNLPEQT